MLNRLIISLIMFFAVLSVMASAEANIQVSPMNITLTSENQYSGSVRVFSNSDEIQYVKASVKRIINPGTPQQQEVAISPDEVGGVIISPQRFILSGQGSHLVRILPMNIPKKEGVYRVYISPVSNDAGDGSNAKEKKAKITINLIWGALVYVAPEHENISLSYNAASGLLTNTGNSHVRISAYGFCQSEENCQWRSLNQSIYPDMDYKITDKNSKEKHSLFVKYQSGKTQNTLKVN